MKRIHVLLLLAACAAPRSAPSADPVARVLALGDDLLHDQWDRFPEQVAFLRPPGVTYDRLPDDSLTGVRVREARHDAWLAELEHVDRRSLEGSLAALVYDVALETLNNLKAARACRRELWPISQMIGWQIRYANLAQAQPVGTSELRAQALTRFTALPAYVDGQIANLREGLRLGYSLPKLNVRQVIEQVDSLIAAPPDRSPYFSPADRDGDSGFRARFEALVRDGIDPALRRYRDFLEKEYLPAARDAVGVSANPNGAACYRAALRLSITLEKEPGDLHALGLAQLSQLEEEMRRISQRSFGGEEVPKLLQRLRADPEYLFRSREEMIAQAQSAIDRARAALPRAFHTLPIARVVIEPIPAFQEKASAPHYLLAAIDGSRAATYRIRLYQPVKQSRALGESTAFHETVPGHHLQIAIANEREGLPALSRFTFNAGFTEGWALYAERLSDELGLYSGDTDRIGMLSNAAWRAARLVVDTGLHAFGWERQRAIDFLLAHTASSADQAAAEIDRYIAWPAQATSDLVGALEIRKLREEAQSSLGARFDLRAFHDRVLEDGSVPLPVLRKNVERWIVATR
jgi:uncharacterized protein (DUF885 family)